jgi:hypothetical protein
MTQPPKPASAYREEAARARRLAALSTDETTSRMLRDFADECDRHAATMAADQRRLH